MSDNLNTPEDLPRSLESICKQIDTWLGKKKGFSSSVSNGTNGLQLLDYEWKHRGVEKVGEAIVLALWKMLGDTSIESMLTEFITEEALDTKHGIILNFKTQNSGKQALLVCRDNYTKNISFFLPAEKHLLDVEKDLPDAPPAEPTAAPSSNKTKEYTFLDHNHAPGITNERPKNNTATEEAKKLIPKLESALKRLEKNQVAPEPPCTTLREEVQFYRGQLDALVRVLGNDAPPQSEELLSATRDTLENAQEPLPVGRTGEEVPQPQTTSETPEREILHTLETIQASLKILEQRHTDESSAETNRAWKDLELELQKTIANQVREESKSIRDSIEKRQNVTTPRVKDPQEPQQTEETSNLQKEVDTALVGLEEPRQALKEATVALRARQTETEQKAKATLEAMAGTSVPATNIAEEVRKLLLSKVEPQLTGLVEHMQNLRRDGLTSVQARNLANDASKEIRSALDALGIPGGVEATHGMLGRILEQIAALKSALDQGFARADQTTKATLGEFLERIPTRGGHGLSYAALREQLQAHTGKTRDALAAEVEGIRALGKNTLRDPRSRGRFEEEVERWEVSLFAATALPPELRDVTDTEPDALHLAAAFRTLASLDAPDVTARRMLQDPETAPALPLAFLAQALFPARQTAEGQRLWDALRYVCERNGLELVVPDPGELFDEEIGYAPPDEVARSEIPRGRIARVEAPGLRFRTSGDMVDRARVILSAGPST